MRFIGRGWKRKNGSQRARLRPQLTQLEDRWLPSVNVLQHFEGIDFSDSSSLAEPPDTIAASGPNHVVEMVNTDMRIYDKSGNTLSTTPLATFFSSLLPSNQSDPFVMFDDGVANGSGPDGRFVVGVLDFTTTTAPNFLDFAVSNDADPTHGFTEMQQINVGNDNLQNFFADYPRAGFNHDAYVVAFNMFSISSGLFDHVQVLSIDKATVTTGTNQTPTIYQNDRSNGLFTMAPSTMHGSVAGDPMWFVTQGLSANTIDVVRMPTPLSKGASFVDTNLGVTAYSQPPAPPQPGGTMTANDSRVLNAAFRNGTLVADQSVGTGGTAHARWYQFSTANNSPNPSQSGDINPGSGIATYFPSIEIDSNGDLGMTYMESSSTEYVSMYVTGRTSSDPTGTMEAGALVAAGSTTYVGGRAGDYSGITVDPSNGGVFWAANEYVPASQGGLWGTALAEFSLTAPATRTWTGGGSTSHWSDANNWSGGVAPNPGDSLVFPASATSFTSTNDFAAGTAFNAVTFSGGGYTVTGNALTLAGGIDASSATGSDSFAPAVTLQNSESVSAGGSTTTLTLGGAFGLGSFTLTVGGGSGAVDFTASIGGTGGLTVNDTGTTTLGGASDTYTGATNVLGGTLVLNNSSGNAVAGSLTVGAATVQWGGSNQVADTAAVTVKTSGLLNLANNSDTIGALNLSGASVTTGTGTLTLGGNVLVSGDSSISGNLGLGAAARTFTVNSGVTLTVTAAVSGSLGLTAAGGGTLVLSGADSYSGGTTLSAGTLAAGSNTALGTGTLTVKAGTTLAASGGAVTLANAVTLAGNATIGGSQALTLSGPITMTASRTLTVSNTATTTFNGAVGQSGTTAFSLTKGGSGTLVLAGPNTYKGSTTVSGGTVLVNGSLAGTATVKSGGTLGGSGTTKTISVQSGGTLIPGLSPTQPAVLNAAKLTLASGSAFDVALNGTTAGSGYSQLVVAGTVSLGGSTLNVALGFTPNIGDAFTIIKNNGGHAVSGTFKGLAEGATFSQNGMTFKITYKGGSGHDVEITRIS
jgi:autotransporter-associated beta strand protein